MKLRRISSLLLGCATFLSPMTLAEPGGDDVSPSHEVSASAEDDAARDEMGKSGKKKKIKASGKMGRAFSELTWITDKEPNPRARHFIYLSSASWCGPCNAEMPHMVEAYEEMKKGKVELILVSFDRSPEAARAFLRKYNADFPVIMQSEALKLPGYVKPVGIPHCSIVDAKGKNLHSGHGSTALQWTTYTGGKKPREKKSRKAPRD